MNKTEQKAQHVQALLDLVFKIMDSAIFMWSNEEGKLFWKILFNKICKSTCRPILPFAEDHMATYEFYNPI